MGFNKKRKSKRRNLAADALGLTTTGAALGVGAGVVTQAGGSPAGVQAIGPVLPIAGKVLGATHALNLLADASQNIPTARRVVRKRKRR